MASAISIRLTIVLAGALIIAALANIAVRVTTPVSHVSASPTWLEKTAWVCVTPRSFCTTAPKPTSAPCTCYDTLQGIVAGRVDRTDLPGNGAFAWPSRGRSAGDDPSPDED